MMLDFASLWLLAAVDPGAKSKCSRLYVWITQHRRWGAFSIGRQFKVSVRMLTAEDAMDLLLVVIHLHPQICMQPLELMSL